MHKEPTMKAEMFMLKVDAATQAILRCISPESRTRATAMLLFGPPVHPRDSFELCLRDQVEEALRLSVDEPFDEFVESRQIWFKRLWEERGPDAAVEW
jgi:hypothetical protein